jgi:hypothetical protein
VVNEWLPALLNLGGAVTVTALFLYYSARREEKGDQVARELVTRVEKMEISAQEHNRTITSEFRDAVSRMHDDIKIVVNDHIAVTRENVAAIAELKAAVASMRTDEVSFIARATAGKIDQVAAQITALAAMLKEDRDQKPQRKVT